MKCYARPQCPLERLRLLHSVTGCTAVMLAVSSSECSNHLRTLTELPVSPRRHAVGSCYTILILINRSKKGYKQPSGGPSCLLFSIITQLIQSSLSHSSTHSQTLFFLFGIPKLPNSTHQNEVLCCLRRCYPRRRRLGCPHREGRARCHWIR